MYLDSCSRTPTFVRAPLAQATERSEETNHSCSSRTLRQFRDAERDQSRRCVLLYTGTHQCNADVLIRRCTGDFWQFEKLGPELDQSFWHLRLKEREDIVVKVVFDQAYGVVGR